MEDFPPVEGVQGGWEGGYYCGGEGLSNREPRSYIFIYIYIYQSFRFGRFGDELLFVWLRSMDYIFWLKIQNGNPGFLCLRKDCHRCLAGNFAWPAAFLSQQWRMRSLLWKLAGSRPGSPRMASLVLQILPSGSHHSMRRWLMLGVPLLRPGRVLARTHHWALLVWFASSSNKSAWPRPGRWNLWRLRPFQVIVNLFLFLALWSLWLSHLVAGALQLHHKLNPLVSATRTWCISWWVFYWLRELTVRLTVKGITWWGQTLATWLLVFATGPNGPPSLRPWPPGGNFVSLLGALTARLVHLQHTSSATLLGDIDLLSEPWLPWGGWFATCRSPTTLPWFSSLLSSRGSGLGWGPVRPRLHPLFWCGSSMTCSRATWMNLPGRPCWGLGWWFLGWSGTPISNGASSPGVILWPCIFIA